MNITYLIGNGFDLALGLKTSYLDFIKSIKDEFKIDKSDNIFEYYSETLKATSKNKLLYDIVNDEKTIDTWADFESKLCLEYIGKINTEEEQRQLIEDIEDFKKRFSVYLKDQSKSIMNNANTQAPSKVYGETISSLFRFEERMLHDNRIKISKSIENKGRNFNIISFNYTKTIEHILSKVKTITRSNGVNSFNYTKSSIIDVHGDVDDSMIMGFGEAELIKNKSILNNLDIKNLIIKTEHNRVRGEGIEEVVTSIINQSDLIIILGMSLGLSDSNWWKLIMSKALKDNIQVIYFAYHNLSKLENHKYGSYINEIKNKLKKCINADDNMSKYIDEMFIVDMGKKMLNYE